MAFCRYCGSQIEDGATCPCRQNENVNANTDFAAQTPAPAAQGSGSGSEFAAKVIDTVKTAANNFVPYVKSYVKAPKATVNQAVTAGNLPVAIGFFALNALALIIAIWSLLGSVAKLGTVASQIGNGFGVKIYIDLPVFRMIFGGILISAAAIAIAAVTLLVFAKIGRSALTYKGALIASALHSFWPTVLVFGGTLVGFIGGVFGIIVSSLALAFALWMIYVTAVSDARSLGGCDVTSTSGKMFLSALVMLVAVTVVTVIASSLFSWCFTGISINDYKLEDIGSLLSGLF